MTMCSSADFMAMQKPHIYTQNVFNDDFRAHVDINNVPILEEEVLTEDKFLTQNIPQDMNSMPMDCQNYAPVTPTAANIPITEEYGGMYNFEIFCSPSKSKNCVYSQLLRKIYIDMEQRLPLRFRWTPSDDNLWLRTTLVYVEDQYKGDPVQRCHNHMATNSPGNQNISPEILRQVVRCLHPRSNYEENDGHMSVTVPLGAQSPGCSYVPLDFQFYCKNSCSSGMNRRATQLVFTLETEHRVTVGRRILQVRICSCPKRDKEKEEESDNHFTAVPTGKKRRLPGFKSISSKLPPTPPGKKLMTPNPDPTECILSFRVPNKEIGKEIYYDVYKILAAKATLSNDYNYFVPFMDEIKRKSNLL